MVDDERPSGGETTKDTILAIYEETVDAIYRSVSRRTGGDRQLSEDVVQETYLRAVREWRRSGIPDEPRAWLRTVARHLVLNVLRRAKPVLLDPVSLDRALESGSDLDDPDQARLLHWGLARLREKDALLLERFYLDGESMRDLARDLGTSEKAIEGRLHRARASLQKKLHHEVARTGGAAR